MTDPNRLFQPHVDADQAMLAASCLDGELLYMLTRECVRTGRVDVLRHLKDCGRFDISEADAIHIERPSEVQASTVCVPMIDSLFRVLTVESNYATDDVGYPSPVHVDGVLEASHLRLELADDMRSFIRDVCFATLERLETLDPALALADDDRVYFSVRRGTAATIAGLAAALDDPELYQAATKRVDDRPWTYLLGGSIAQQMRCEDLTPLVLAIRMSSMKVLESCPAEHIMEAHGHRDDYGSSQWCSFDSFLSFKGGAPRPEVISVLVRRLLSEKTPDGDYKNLANSRWLTDELLQSMFGGPFAHALPVVFAENPELLDVVADDCLTFSTRFCRKDVLVEMLSRFPELPEVPPVSDYVPHRLLPDEHPLAQLIDAIYQSEAHEDPDGCILAVMERMVEVGQGDVLLDPSVRANAMSQMPLLHVLAEKNLTQSIVWLVSKGYDTYYSESSNLLPPVADWMEGQDETGIAQLIRSCYARRAAHGAMAELGLSTFSTPGGAARCRLN